MKYQEQSAVAAMSVGSANHNSRRERSMSAKCYGVSIAALLGLAVTQFAGAQQTTTQTQTTSAGDMTEIIVTARRVEERLQDVPISIQVFSQGQLDRHDITTS